MITARILALGKFLPKDIVVSVSESNRKINPVVESKVDLLWENKIKEAERLGQTCYNGISYRINSLKEQDGILDIDLGTIEFKTRTCLIEIPGYFDLPEGYYRKGCYSGATVKTSDNLYVIVELSGKSLNKNQTDLLGGLIEKPLEIKNSDDIFLAIYNELEEESCIEKNDISSIYLRAVYLTAKTDVGFYFETSLKVSSTEVLEKFKKQNQDRDIKSLKFLKRDEYFNYLQIHSSSKKLISEVMSI